MMKLQMRVGGMFWCAPPCPMREAGDIGTLVNA